MSVKCVKVEKSTTWDNRKEGEEPIAVLYFSKSTNPLQMASMNGDGNLYPYPVSVTMLYPKKSANDAFDSVKEEYADSEIADINLFDIPVNEVCGFDAVKVVDNDNLSAITVFKRASFDDRQTVVTRLKAQVARQLKDNQLKGVEE